MDSASCLFNIPQRKMNIYNSQFNFEDTLEQFNDEIKLKATFPGKLQSYDLKDQCQHIFGPESDVCDHNLVSQLNSLKASEISHSTKMIFRTLIVKYYGVKLITELLKMLPFNVWLQIQNGRMGQLVEFMNQE